MSAVAVVLNRAELGVVRDLLDVERTAARENGQKDRARHAERAFHKVGAYMRPEAQLSGRIAVLRLREALERLMAAEGGEPGDGPESKSAWRCAEMALAATRERVTRAKVPAAALSNAVADYIAAVNASGDVDVVEQKLDVLKDLVGFPK